MNKKIFPLLLTLSLVPGITSIRKEQPMVVFAACDPVTYQTTLPTTFVLSDSTDNEIRNYYAELNTKSAEERKGTNLLKNLKPILRHNFVYYPYAKVWNIYEITDRDWSLSPASESCADYDEATNTLSNYQYGQDYDNPYIHCYYRDHKSTNPSIIENSKIRAWGNHTASGINREHLWPQSHGFPDSSTKNVAASDLHHLVAGDGNVNQAVHNNEPYGYVLNSVGHGNKISTSNNIAGSPMHVSSSDEGTKVFEPQDQDKGDVARACFYMAAMYNNYANETDVISKLDPNLKLVPYVTVSTEQALTTDTDPAVYGNLRDLLEWNRLDPVDEYEIHRNNLIFNNFEHNRNPFIDFPEWAEFIWGDVENTRSADPTSDVINDFRPKKEESDCDNHEDEGGETETPTNDESKQEKKKDFTWVYIVSGVVAIGIITAVVLVVILKKKKAKKA